MSNLEGEVDFQQVIKDGEDTPEQQAVESSRDSSESSGASSQSGDESGSASSSSNSDQDDRKDDGSGEHSDGVSNESVATEKSSESYKSVNTSTMKVDVSVDSKELKTPVVPRVKASVKIVKNVSPSKVEMKTPKAVVSSTKKDGRSKSQSMSPVQVTPAKSMVIGESPIRGQSDAEVKSPSGKGSGASKQRSTSASAPASNNRELGVGPRQGVGPVAAEPRTGDKPVAIDQSAAERKRSRHPEKAVKKELQSPKKKRVKKVKEKVDRVRSQSESVVRMEEQVKQLQAQLDKVVSADRGRDKRNVKDKKQKSSKSKKSKTHSSGEVSSQSSSVDEPTTSSRIGKISTGRKNQRIAMSRTKQLGVIRHGEIQVLEVSEALKIIDKAVFVISPTHGYKHFNRLPGVELPHIQTHVKELMERMGLVVKLTAKLCLELAREQDVAKKLRVGPEAENEYATLWQFANDLSRATAADQYFETTAAIQAEGLDGAKAASKVTKGDSKVVGDDKASSSDQQKGATASKQKVAKDKKKKSAGSRTEERPE